MVRGTVLGAKFASKKSGIGYPARRSYVSLFKIAPGRIPNSTLDGAVISEGAKDCQLTFCSLQSEHSIL